MLRNRPGRYRACPQAFVLLFAVAFCGHLSPLARAAAAATVNACGTISSNTVWTATNVYVVNNCSAVVATGATLTVQPGTVVKFGGASAVMVVQGTLTAQGTGGALIAFTSLRDDSRGGDSNGDGPSTAHAGDWSAVRFAAGSHGRLAHVFVGFGGSGGFDYGGRYAEAEVESFSSDVTLDHVTLQASGNSGLYCNNASVQVTYGQVSDNVLYGLYWDGVDAAVPLVVTDTAFSGNGAAGWLHFRDAAGTITFQRNTAAGAKNGFRADGRHNQGSLLWDNAGNLPLVITPGVRVAPDTTWTLMPGTVVKLSGGSTTLDVQGALRAEGTSVLPIAFTSANDDSRAGDTNGDGASTGAPAQWASVRFESGSQGRVTYASFEYGGSGAFDYVGRYGVAMFESFSSDVTLDHVTIRASGNSGLYANNASVRVTNGQVNNNGQYGLYWDGVDAAVPLVVSDTTFTGNGTAAGWMHFRDAAGTVTFERNSATGPRNAFRADGRLNGGLLTWNNGDDLPLLISGGLTIAPTTTLTLDPGAIVKFGNGRDVLVVQGVLQALGTAGSPIVLTSASDDAHGGDTNGDGPSQGQSGQWSGLRFAAGSSGRLAYVFIAYGGSGAFDFVGRYGVGMVESFSSDVTVDHCTLHASGRDGLYAENTTVTFTNGSVSDNVRYGLNYNGLDAGVPLVVTGNVFNGSQGGAARLDLNGNPPQITFQGNTGSGTQRAGFSLAGTITSNAVWDNTGSLPLVIDGGLTVAAGATLTVTPGTVVKFASQSDVLVVSGTLIAAGSDAAPIAFTSVRDDSHGGDTNGDGASVGVAGDWSALRFAAGSTGRLAYTYVGFGGSGVFDYARRYTLGMLESFSSDVTIDHCTVQASARHGLYVADRSVTVTDTHFTGNQSNGAYYDGIDPVTPLAVRGNVFSGNGTYGAHVRIADSAAQIRVDHNQTVAPKNGVRVSGGLTQGFLRWDNPNAPMVIDGGLAVRAGAELTVESGSVVKFAGGADVLQIEGTLTAEGTFLAPIAFTSISDDVHGGDTNGDGPSTGTPGQWAGLRFLSGSQVSLRHSFIGYGGSGAYDHLGVYGRGLVDVRGGSIQIKHGEVRSSALHGLYVENAAVTIAYAAITDHAQNGIYNGTPSVDVDARYNWWGDASGPQHPTLNPAGKGSAVSNGVLVAPWLNRFTWLEPTTTLVHGVTPLSWSAFDIDPATLTSAADATGIIGTQVFGRDYPASGGVAWDTRPLPNGRYELRASWRDLAGSPVNEQLRQVVVNNDPSLVWHGGRLTTDETWEPGHVHVVEGDVFVAAGVRLTIAPGTVVKFTPGTRIIVEDGGAVDAPATEAAPIVLTSVTDDVSGDTNLDGSQSLPRPGDWDGITTRGTGTFNDTPFVDLRYTQSNHSGILLGNERWRGSFVHRVTGDVTVPSGVTLTIDAGAVVKFDAYKGLIVQPGGHLVALGSVAERIVFTSIRDDTAGGDTNGDGNTSAPEAGDWRWIYVDGAGATFDHAELRYGGGTSSGNWDQTGMIRTNGAASLTVTNSVLRDAFFDGILAWGGTAAIRSSIFTNIDRAISAHPGSPVHVVNCTLDGNRIGLLIHGGSMDVTNSIVSNNYESGIQYDFGTLAAVRYSDVWAAGSTSVNYRNTPDQTGSNGNISKDPHYVDREVGNYRLDYRSPAIDAADGPAAPATDIVGVPRYDDPRTPNTGIAAAGGAYADIGASEFAETADSNLDLIVSSVSGPTAAVAGESVRVQWTVTNIGSAQVVGPWHDTVNLVLSPDANPTVMFAAEVLVGDGVKLGPGQRVSTAATIRVPGSVVGTHYWQVMTNTRGEVFEGRNWENNTTQSLAPVALDLPELVIGGAALSRQFDAVGQAHWFKFTPAAGQDILVRLDRAGTGGVTELYVAQGYMPSRVRFDARQNERNAPDVSTLAASTSTQTYYVFAYPASLSGGAASFTIGAQVLDFSIEWVGPAQVGNAGPVTLAVHGGQLRSDMTFEIIDAHGGVHTATAVFLADSSLAYVTFDLSGLPTGAYDVRVRDGARTVSLTDGFNVTVGTPGAVQAQLVMPKAMRPDWTETVTVEYANVGNTDVVAPLMVLSVQNAKLQLPGKTEFVYPTVQLLGINGAGPAGVLPPGAHNTITLQMQPTASAGTITGKLWVLSDPNQPWDWNAAKSLMRPDFVPADAWEAIFANFTAKVGTTVGQYDGALAEDATYLSHLGEYTGDVQRLLAFELNQAGLYELTQRYALGGFGRGVPAWWEMRANVDASGNVRIGLAAAQRFFLRQGDGSYRGVGGEFATLTVTAGAYELLETDGERVVFRPDGKLDFIEDLNGNRVTADYSSGRTASLTKTNGDRVTFTYDGHGRITEAVDAVGRRTTYGYDANGEHLVRFSGADGEMTFTYLLGQGSAREHALATVAFPDETHLFFEYDTRGRLIHSHADGGAEERNYTYGAAGAFTETNALGQSSTVLSNDAGAAARVTDPSGSTVALLFDSRQLPTRLSVPSGGSFAYRFDADGNPIDTTNPLGHHVTADYEGGANRPTVVMDGAANTTRLNYDAHGNLLGLTYPDGTGDRLQYGSTGQITQWLSGLGRGVTYGYDPGENLVSMSFSDGASTSFTYDTHRNVLTTSGAGGATSFVYDGADRVTRITYPSGHWLAFAYDTGGRRSRSETDGGQTVHYAYDAAGRLATLRNGNDDLIVSYAYDAAGRLARRDLGNGTYTTYEYDAASRIAHLVNHRADGTVLSRFEYGYDAAGRLVTLSTLDGAWTYEHDAAGQLTGAAFTSVNPAMPNQLLAYTYDAAGNRRSAVRNGVATTYAVNALNQYTGAGSSTYNYDAAGNLIAWHDGSEGWQYRYDDGNRLTSATGPDGVWTYEYDAFGNRVAAEHEGVRTEFVIDPVLGDVVASYNGAGSLIAQYVHGLGLASRIDAAGTSHYYDFDAIGHTSELTDASGTAVNRYAYLPYGEPLLRTESLDNPFQYVGELGVMTEIYGLHMMGARYYDPRDGRFVQRDPLGLVSGTNLYAYVNNSPVEAVDPSGFYNPFAALNGNLANCPIPGVDPRSGAGMEWVKNMFKPGAIRGPYREYTGLRRLTDHGLKRFFGRGGSSAGSRILTNAGRNLVSTAGRNVVTTAGRAAATTAVQSAAASESAATAAGIGTSTGLWATLNTPVAALGAGTVVVAGTVAAVAGYAAGTLIRYIPGVDEGAQSAWIKLNDWTGGWLLGTPPAAELGTPLVSSHDPNDLIGPAGNGTAHWITPDQTLPYKIRFENDKQATAPAQVVRITEQLDPGLDYSTFELGSFNFDGVTVPVPPGLTFYSERLDLRATHGLYLDITANLDLDTGLVTWEFTSIDPVTGRTPRDPLTGFLPPNVISPIGEGYVTYTIRTRSSVGIGTPITAEARIVFDTNDPIDTPLHRNPVGPMPDCTGDCDASLQVTVNELLAMVHIALGNVTPAACIAGDLNLDGTVTVDEIVIGVSFALNGCPLPIVPPPTPSATVTVAVPSPSPTRTPTAAVAAPASATPTATATPTPIEAQPTPTLTPLF
ncbi:MAG: repeat-associated core domain protein [Deltaproteobacteria bacterium]|nr:repeat-associated core domain protein [Deltaproteobacteria bacterium]